MSLSDWLQVVSLAAVAIALFLNVWQNRLSAKQALEASRQSEAVLVSLRQGAYVNFLNSQAEYRAIGLADPEMLRWQLASRGYGVGSDLENRRTLFILVRLGSHESSFLSYSANLLDEDVWTGWRRVIESDFQVPEFVSVWAHGKQFFATSFVAFVDDEILAGHEISTSRAPAEG